MKAEFDELVQVAGVIDQAEADMLVRSACAISAFRFALRFTARI
jgi:hypothetical protein